MALPTITSNSPSAGYIAWTAFGISYDGGSYTVAAGNAVESFVIWKYNAGVPTILKTNTFPNNLTADDLILFLNKGGVGALVPMSDVLDGSLVVPQSIIANSIAANAIQTTHLNSNSVTAVQIKSNTILADNISANAITGDELAFNAVTTEHLSVGSVGNSLVTNGSFEELSPNGIPTGWLLDAGGTSGTLTAATGVATSGNYVAKLTCPAITDKAFLKQTPAKYIPVTSISGRSWYVSVKLGGSVATTDGLYVRAVWYDANKQYVTWSNITAEDGSVVSDKAVTTAFTTYEGQATPPSTARYMSVEVSLQLPNVANASLYVDEVMAREVVVSAVIGDGQISTPKIMTNAIVANHIQSNVIQANHIVGNSITADKLLVSDFTNITDGGNFDVAADLANFTLAGNGISVTTSLPYAGAGCLQVTADPASRSLTLKNKPSVKAGEKYWVSYWFKSTADWNGTTGNSKFRFGDQINANKGQVTHNVASTAWVERTQEFVVPAGVTNLTLSLNFDHTVGTAWIDNLTMRRRFGGELIVDGSIITEHMQGNSINANVLLVNTINTNHIAFNAITGNQINVNAITATHIGSNVITANHINANVITAKHIGANVITSNMVNANAISTIHLASNAVTANEIGANAIVAKHIGAASIAANKLIVGSAVNALPDPSFLIPELTALRLARSTGGAAGWTVGTPTATGIPTISRLTTGTADGLHYEAASPTLSTVANAIRVSEGQKWRMEVDVETDISAGVRWNYYAYKADGTVAAYAALSGYSTAIGRRTLGYTYTVPAGVVAIDLAVACNTTGVNLIVYGGAIVALQTATTLIEDGAVTTTLIAANAIVANKIATNAITATHVSANAITATHINANAITAVHLSGNAIDGKTITGATIIGGEVKTSATTNAITARLGPITAYDPFSGGQKAGIGFLKVGGTGSGPSMYSNDGHDLYIMQGGPAIDDGNLAYLSLGADKATMFCYSDFTVQGGSGGLINAGNGQLSLMGTPVTINGIGVGLNEISYYESTGSKANFDTANQGVGTPAYLSGSSTTNLGTSAAGQVTVTTAGVYSVTATLNLYADAARTNLKAATGRSFIDIADSTGAAYSRTALPVGEDQTTGSLTGIKLGNNAVVKFNIIQTTGGTAYYKVRIWLTRIG